MGGEKSTRPSLAIQFTLMSAKLVEKRYIPINSHLLVCQPITLGHPPLHLILTFDSTFVSVIHVEVSNAALDGKHSLFTNQLLT